MGKRKPRRKAPPKMAPPKLEEEFDCPFCSAIKSVGVLMRRKDRQAILSCRGCPVSYEMTITPLDEPVDVYSSWIDTCEEVNAPAPTAVGGASIPQVFSGVPTHQPGASISRFAARAPPEPKRRRVDRKGGAEDEDFSDGEMEREALEEEAFEEEEAFSAENDSAEEEAYSEEEDDEPAIDTTAGDFEVPAAVPTASGGRLKKKAAWGSDDESE